MSDKDLSTLLPAPVTGLVLESLSIKASTASCKSLFSLFIITVGAFNCSIWRSLLFLFIILLYKSFKSDVANRPPSKATKGLKSGGITGRVVRIIHSGLVPEFKKPSTTLSFLISLALSASDFVFLIPAYISFTSSFRFISERSFLIAEAPISTFKLSPKPSRKFFISLSSSNTTQSGFEKCFIKGISFLEISILRCPSYFLRASGSFLKAMKTLSFSMSKNSNLIFLSGSVMETVPPFSNFSERILFTSLRLEESKLP